MIVTCVYKKSVRRWKNNRLFSVFEVMRRFLCRCYQAGAYVTVRRKPSTAEHTVCIHTMSIKELLISFSVSMLMQRLPELYWSLCRVSFNKSQKTQFGFNAQFIFFIRDCSLFMEEDRGYWKNKNEKKRQKILTFFWQNSNFDSRLLFLIFKFYNSKVKSALF